MRAAIRSAAGVFPIPPKGYNRVLIAYEETLPVIEGQQTYRFPLPEGKLNDLTFSLRARPERIARSIDPAGRHGQGGRRRTASLLAHLERQGAWRRHPIWLPAAAFHGANHQRQVWRHKLSLMLASARL